MLFSKNSQKIFLLSYLILSNYKKADSILHCFLANHKNSSCFFVFCKNFVFYDGPAYANGFPGVHHMLAKILKDAFTRSLNNKPEIIKMFDETAALNKFQKMMIKDILLRM